MFSLLDPLKGTSIDVGFSMSATSQDASTTIKLIRDSIAYFIDSYGTTNIRYCIMTFGERPTILAPFAEKQSPEDLKKIIESATLSAGKPNLVNLFPEVKSLFEKAGARPYAQKFLVVFVDNKSPNERVDLIEASKPLIEQELWIVPVAIGEKSNEEELQLITTLKSTTVKVPSTGDPKKTAEEIADKMKERE